MFLVRVALVMVSLHSNDILSKMPPKTLWLESGSQWTDGEVVAPLKDSSPIKGNINTSLGVLVHFLL